MSPDDEIAAILDTALSEAMAIHEGEVLNRHRTGAALAQALERYNRFTRHGMIPEDLSDDAVPASETP